MRTAHGRWSRGWSESRRVRTSRGRATRHLRLVQVEDVAVSRLVPPHAVRTRAKYEKIAASMRRSGWQGRPLVGLGELGTDRVLLLTGSHRYAASARAGLESVPVVVVRDLGADWDVSRGKIKYKGKLLKGLLNKRKAFRASGFTVGLRLLMAETPSKKSKHDS